MPSTYRYISRALAIAACGLFAALPARSAPASGAAPTDRLLQAFIRDNYGAWRADRKGWQQDQDDFIYQSCGSLRVATPDGSRYLLAMCGETVESVQNGTPGMDSDATPGTIDLYVLKPVQDGKGLEPVLKKTDIASGKRGEPGRVSIERLGPHLFGFVIGDGVMLQGYLQSMRAIWLPHGNALVLAAPRINDALDNTGSDECENAKARCEVRNFKIVPDTTGTDDVYPLIVTETGTRGNKDIDARYVVRFDVARGRYIVPKALREGY
ncbi:topoisomerase IV [Burkholderia sp. MR1-5-21]